MFTSASLKKLEVTYLRYYTMRQWSLCLATTYTTKKKKALDLQTLGKENTGQNKIKVS